MVEGARLESVYARKGIEGSNPSLSAWIDIQNLFLLKRMIGKKVNIYGNSVPDL